MALVRRCHCVLRETKEVRIYPEAVAFQIIINSLQENEHLPQFPSFYYVILITSAAEFSIALFYAKKRNWSTNFAMFIALSSLNIDYCTSQSNAQLHSKNTKYYSILLKMIQIIMIFWSLIHRLLKSFEHILWKMAT